MSTETTIADGVVGETDDGRDLIRFERRIAHPIDAVWAALTEPGRLIRWWGDATVELAEGGEFTLRWLNEGDEGEQSILHGRIAELEPPRLLAITGTWTAAGAAHEPFDQDETSLRFELEPAGEATVLRFENALRIGADKFRTMVPAGWHFHLDALATALDGDETDLVNVTSGWNPIHEAYLARTG